MKKKVHFITGVTEPELVEKINEFFEQEGARWRLVNVYRFGKAFVYYTAWLEFEG